jgi:4-oxalocrotonate tautomerase
MPYVEITLFDHRVSDEVAARLGDALTDAVCEVLGEPMRSQTWVVVSGVPAARWTIAGRNGATPASRP